MLGQRRLGQVWAKDNTMCDFEKNQKGVQFGVGQGLSPLWEKIWKRLFYRRRGVNKVPRAWSNRELNKIGTLLSGSVLNCSGWCDEDKQGGRRNSRGCNIQSI